MNRFTLGDEDKKNQFDFVSALAQKALDVPAEREPAGKAVDAALSELKSAQKKGQAEYQQMRGSAIKTANYLDERASQDAKEAAAAGVSGATELIKGYRSLKGFTYADLLKAGGYDKELPEQEMGTAEMLTRFSMAILPGLAGYLAGKATGSANPYIMAAGGAEAGVKGLEYLNQLDTEKRKRAQERQMAGAKAVMQEAEDERRMMREALLLPEKARLEAQELSKQIQLAAAKESLGKAFEARKETPEELAARERLREATELEKEKIKAAKESTKEKKLGKAEETYLTKSAGILVNRSKTIDKIDSVLEILRNPNIPDGQKVVQGRSLLKPMNDPDNPDALQQAEAARLTPYLEFQILNVMPGSPGATFGRDLPGFIKQLELTKQTLEEGYSELQSDIEKIKATGSIPTREVKKVIPQMTDRQKRIQELRKKLGR